MRRFILARTIFKETLLWMGMGLLGVVLIFLITQFMRVAPLFAGAGASFSEVLAMLALLSVPVCGWSLTPAFAVAVFAAFGRMAKDGERLAVDAAGVRPRTLMRGPLVLALGATLLSGAIWLDWAPRSQAHLRSRVVALAEQGIVGGIPEGVFVQPIAGTTFYADERIDGETYRGVFFENGTEPQRVVQVAAREARLRMAPHRERLQLQLQDGTAFISSSAELRAGEGPPRDMALTFGTLNVAIDIGDAVDQKLDFLPPTMAVSTPALLTAPPPGQDTVAWRFAFWRRVAGPLGTLVFSLLALMLAVSARFRSRGAAVALAAGLFLAFHLVGRLAESSMTAGIITPPVAALIAVGLVTVAGLIVWWRDR